MVRAERNQTLLHPPAGIGLGLVLPRTRLSQWDRLSPGSRDCALPSYSLTLLCELRRPENPSAGCNSKVTDYSLLLVFADGFVPVPGSLLPPLTES